MSLPSFLAQIPATVSDEFLTFKALGGLAFTIVSIRSVLGMIIDWRSLRKSDDEGKDYVTQDRLDEVDQRAQGKIDVVHKRVDTIFTTLAAEVGKMHGDLGAKLDRQASDAQKSRDAVQEDLKGMERSLGRLEGLEKIIEEHSRVLNEHGRKPR